MKTDIYIEMSEQVKEALWNHILPEEFLAEEAAFLFVKRELSQRETVFQVVEWEPIPSSGFAIRSEFHFELADETRAAVIKKAHDLGSSLVEVHSHSGEWEVAFSASDLYGFREFVPHIWWRLKGRPYGAIVVGRSGFDGFIWVNRPDEPLPLTGIRVGDKLLKATGHSSVYPKDYDYDSF